MECSCSVNSGYDDDCGSWGVQSRKAAKEHKCYECGSEISKGEFYLFHTVFKEGVIRNFKLCLDCDGITKAFFSYGWVFGSVIDDLKEYLYEKWQEDLPSSCISKLPTGAQQLVCDILQEYQQS